MRIILFLQSGSDVYTLLVALQHIILIFIVELTESFHDLVLARKVDLFKRFLQLRFYFHTVVLQTFYSGILGINQELEILTFILQLSKHLLPLQLTCISPLFNLYYFKMQLIVFFCQSFIFLLQRNEALLIQLVIMFQYFQLIF